MTDAELLDKLWEHLCEHCVERCEEAGLMLEGRRVPREVRRAIGELEKAVNVAVFAVRDAYWKAEKAERPSATVHPLRPEL